MELDGAGKSKNQGMGTAESAIQSTSATQFNKSYLKSNHIQQKYNNEYIPIFCKKIEEYHQKIKKPLKIIDLCCGHGGPTIDLYRELVKSKVQVESIQGWDISEELIGIAVERSKEEGLEKNVRFQRRDVDGDFGGIAEVDAVVSFFGLHWAKDIGKVGENIAGMLKNGGVFCALTPLEVNKFFAVRQEFINTSKWSTIFQGPSKILKAFHGTPEPYRKAFSPYFTSQKDDHLQLKNPYTLKMFILFLRSWMPQVRYLMGREPAEPKKEQIAREYLEQLMENAPNVMEKEIEKVGKDEVFWYQPLHVFVGTKIQCD